MNALDPTQGSGIQNSAHSDRIPENLGSTSVGPKRLLNPSSIERMAAALEHTMTGAQAHHHPALN
jgi:hypothetical protein